MKWGTLFPGDICNLYDLRTCFQRYPIQEVIHFAALSLVAESGIKPAEYYQTNVIGTLNLLQVMKEFGVRSIVFSSSAAVYGEPQEIPIPESHPLRPVNVYGRTKVIMEQLMADFQLAYGINFAALRYFNAAGADPDGEIGEVHEPETHLIPNIMRTAFGMQDILQVYGDDYPTPDGTPIRDYIDVSDLAQAHLAALRKLREGGSVGAVNLGSATGYSVKEVIAAAEQTLQRTIPKEVKDRRPGDPAVLVASNQKAREILGWTIRQSNLVDMVKTAAAFFAKG